MKTKAAILGLMVVALMLASCSLSKSVLQQRNLLSGTWQLNDIYYADTTNKYKGIVFGDQEDICFEGSNWFFRDNNSTGRYTIAPSSLCQAGDRSIRWSVVDNENGLSQLQFKFVDEKRKDINQGVGYRLDIANLTEAQMTLRSRVSDNGETVTLVYEFSKQ